jgi:hypothetical protein
VIRTQPGSAVVAMLLVAVVLLAPACSRRPPVLEPLLDLDVRTPVVMIPGITGSKLRDRETGKVVWGNSRSIFSPRDGGRALTLPIGAEEDRIEAFAPILEFSLFGILKVDIYRSIQRMMLANGYTLGDLAAPRPGEDFFFFPYDWRQGNVRAAGELVDRLEALRVARGEEVLHVTLVCQSNAARIARYVVKYGAGSLDEAERGTASRPPRIAIDKIILLGTANGGALRTLDDLHEGKRYVAGIGRKLRPEAIFTMWSLYEALPFYRNDFFFDEENRVLDARLSEASDWKHYGWSIFSAEASRRADRAERPELFGDDDQRLAFVAEALDRARRLHRLLLEDVEGFGPTAYYSIQNDSRPTPSRALLTPDGDGWKTRVQFPGRKSDRRPLAQEPGDGHATVESQLRLSPQELAALAHEPVYVSYEHRKIVIDPETLHWILEFLLD